MMLHEYVHMHGFIRSYAQRGPRLDCVRGWKCAGYNNPALSAHNLPPSYLFSSFHPSFRHPSHKPFNLETLVLQPSNAQKTSITKTALQRFDLDSWTVCVFKTLFHWWIQYEIPAKFSLGSRSFKPNNYFLHIKYINLLAKSYMTTQYYKNN